MNLHVAQQSCATCLAIRRRLVRTQLRLQQAWAAHCHLLRVDPAYAASAAAAAAAVATRDSLLELLIGLAAALLALFAAIRRLNNRQTLP